MIKVGFIEDDQHYLSLMQKAIHLQPNMICNFYALSVEQFWEKLPSASTVDILFVDICLPGQSGIDAIPKLRQRFPQAEIVMLTQMEDEALLMRALIAGASGYLTKDFNNNQIVNYIHILIRGGALLSPLMARKLVDHFRPNLPQTEHLDLSFKEAKILELFSMGYSYEETAQNLGIGLDGVRYHVKHIYQKLHVKSKVEAINKYKYIEQNQK